MLQRHHERRGVQPDAIGRLPVAGHAECDQLRARVVVQQSERAVQRAEVPALAEIADDHVRGARLGIGG